MQRGLPRGSFEQNEVDEYHTGRPERPGGARSDPLEAVDRGVPPKLARVESVVVVAPIHNPLIKHNLVRNNKIIRETQFQNNRGNFPGLS